MIGRPLIIGFLDSCPLQKPLHTAHIGECLHFRYLKCLMKMYDP